MSIEELAPEAFQRLASWPPLSVPGADGQPHLSLALGIDPMNMILDHVPGMQVIGICASEILFMHAYHASFSAD